MTNAIANPVAVSPGQNVEILTAGNATSPFLFSLSVGTGYLTGESTEQFGWEARGGDYIYSIRGFRDTSTKNEKKGGSDEQ